MMTPLDVSGFVSGPLVSHTDLMHTEGHDVDAHRFADLG
jgi:hypothetical protein